MVYRGKPSAGCENCRKAKKRCGLEIPSCLRCVKLKKQCSGYRDTTVLQIQDESEAVRQKALRSHAKSTGLVPPKHSADHNHPTPSTTNTDSSLGSDDQLELIPVGGSEGAFYDEFDDSTWFDLGGDSLELIPMSAFDVTHTLLRPNPDDLATTYFFQQFASNSSWQFLKTFARKPDMDPCLDLAIRACGMAALDNVDSVVLGRNYAQTMYVEALGLLNAALRDPKRSRTDEALIAVTMLGYYENLTCDSRESIQSWKAHISGATQMLRLRGRAQFISPIGRVLFREIRTQILTTCIWDDTQPPAFLWDWNVELHRLSPEHAWTDPGDALSKICFDFASLRARVCSHEVPDAHACAAANAIDARMIQWKLDVLEIGPHWAYNTVQVLGSPHVWRGAVHTYSGSPAPGTWNTYRSIRIMVTRTQELLTARLNLPPAEHAEQQAYFRSVRSRMEDEICACVPTVLGHVSSTGDGGAGSCTLMSAYGAIWPLFFAGTCALERVRFTAGEEGVRVADLQQVSEASAQAAWILGRLDYISSEVGLKWAQGIAAVLKGDFRIHSDLLPEQKSQKFPWSLELKESRSGARALMEAERTFASRPMWEA